MSQEGLAKQLGVAFASLNRWECGKKLPTMKSMSRILKFCEEQGFDPDRKAAVHREWLKETVERDRVK